MVAEEIPWSQDPAQAIDLYIKRLKSARVSEEILDDAMAVYAREHASSDDECDGLLAQFDELPWKSQTRKAILDVIFTVIAATELPFDTAFRAIVDQLDVHEEEPIMRSLKQSLLQRMILDIEDGGQGAISIAEIQRRLAYVESCIG